MKYKEDIERIKKVSEEMKNKDFEPEELVRMRPPTCCPPPGGGCKCGLRVLPDEE